MAEWQHLAQLRHFRVAPSKACVCQLGHIPKEGDDGARIELNYHWQVALLGGEALARDEACQRSRRHRWRACVLCTVHHVKDGCPAHVALGLGEGGP
eukprot:3183996-Prymnesium_polylepis.1